MCSRSRLGQATYALCFAIPTQGPFGVGSPTETNINSELVELRGFEPLTSAEQAPVRATAL
jgi:hypothetical protein